MKVLINESNRDIRELYRAIFHPFHAEITFTNSIKETEDLIHHHRFDLIFLDIGSKLEEEIIAADKVHKKYPTLPLVVISSVPLAKSLILRFYSKPMRAVMMKPFDIIRMREFIHRCESVYKSNKSSESYESTPLWAYTAAG